ncbi:MAG: hypothetical protein H6668_17390 [Ardenticatenaceae bacterium]|nr:hypothetical protein [Ardenticatenaceae bacterium]
MMLILLGKTAVFHQLTSKATQPMKMIRVAVEARPSSQVGQFAVAKWAAMFAVPQPRQRCPQAKVMPAPGRGVGFRGSGQAGRAGAGAGSRLAAPSSSETCVPLLKSICPPYSKSSSTQRLNWRSGVS